MRTLHCSLSALIEGMLYIMPRTYTPWEQLAPVEIGFEHQHGGQLCIRQSLLDQEPNASIAQDFGLCTAEGRANFAHLISTEPEVVRARLEKLR